MGRKNSAVCGKVGYTARRAAQNTADIFLQGTLPGDDVSFGSSMRVENFRF